MSGELFSKLKNKWYRFVWDYLTNNKSSILLKECSKELIEAHNIIKVGDDIMTENKRFTIDEDKIKDNQSPYCYIEYYNGLVPIVDLLNELAEENQMLRETLKNQYINEICETCKFGQYEVNWYGEGEFECLKGHDAVECDEKTECEDFELKITEQKSYGVEMSEKRFTFADGFKIVAIRENGEIMNSVRVCDKLNELYEENEQLNQLLDYADDLIQSHLSEHYIRQWRNFKTGHKEYNDFWEEKIKKHNELKEDVE